MLQKFKITFYALIVLLVLVLPSQADAVEFYADSCKGWNCSIEKQVCPQGAEGASDKSFICSNSRWEPTAWNQDIVVNCLKYFFSDPRTNATIAKLIKSYNNAMASTTQPWMNGGCGLDENWQNR